MQRLYHGVHARRNTSVLSSVDAVGGCMLVAAAGSAMPEVLNQWGQATTASQGGCILISEQHMAVPGRLIVTPSLLPTR